MELNLTLSNEKLQEIANDIYERAELDVEAIRSETLQNVCSWFSMKFGTYTKDDTIKVTEVFDILKEITERLMENNDEKTHTD